jgi:ADP-glucose pyrophosphorylase
VGGPVERSLLGPGVAIAGEAFVRDSILFHDACVERGATLTRVIVAGSVEIGDDAIVGAACDEVTIIGGKAVFPRGQMVATGSQVVRKAGST